MTSDGRRIIKYCLLGEIIGLLCLIAACAEKSQQAIPTLTLSPTHGITQSQVPKSGVKSATFTAIPPSPTSRLSTTITQTPTFVRASTSTPENTETQQVIQRQWISILTEIPPETALQGALVLENNPGDVYFLDLEDFSRHTFPATSNAGVGGFTASPDRKWLAYIESVPDERGYTQSLLLRLINASGQRNMLSYWVANWQMIVGWLDNQKLALWLPGRPNGAITVLNPFTGHWQEILPTFPIFDDNLFNHYGPTAVLYDSTLYYAVYEGGLSNGSSLSLWDVQAGKILWQERTNGHSPAWSPDGKQFAVTIDGVIYTVNLVGQETEIFDIADTEIPYSKWSNIGQLNWSPDGTNIAVWLGDHQRLAIINVLTKQATDLCIENNSIWSSSPIWSPDGQYLAIATSRDVDRYSRQTLIVDIRKSIAYKVADDIGPAAWLKKP